MAAGRGRMRRHEEARGTAAQPAGGAPRRRARGRRPRGSRRLRASAAPAQVLAGGAEERRVIGERSSMRSWKPAIEPGQRAQPLAVFRRRARAGRGVERAGSTSARRSSDKVRASAIATRSGHVRRQLQAMRSLPGAGRATRAACPASQACRPRPSNAGSATARGEVGQREADRSRPPRGRWDARRRGISMPAARDQNEKDEGPGRTSGSYPPARRGQGSDGLTAASAPYSLARGWRPQGASGTTEEAKPPSA